MDCRCRKLSLFPVRFLSAVGVLEQDCRYIFCNFGAMSLVAKNPWKASKIRSTEEQGWHSRLVRGLGARGPEFDSRISHPCFDSFPFRVAK